MALPSSGPLSIGAIRTELGSGSGSLRTLSAAAGKSTPDSMSEFYGYSAYTPPSLQSWGTSQSGAGTQANPYVITRTSFTKNNPADALGGCGDYIADIQFEIISRQVFWNAGIFINQTNVPQRGYVTINTLNTNGQWLEGDQFSEIFWQNGITFGSGAVFETYFGQNSPTLLRNAWQNRMITLTNTTVGRQFSLQIKSRQIWREDGYGCEDWQLYYQSFYNNYDPSITNLTLSVWFEPI